MDYLQAKDFVNQAILPVGANRDFFQAWPQFYEAIFQAAGISMAVIEDDTTIILANLEMEQLSGLSRKELEGKRQLTALIHPKDLGRMLLCHRQSRAKEGLVPENCTVKFVDVFGREKEILLSISLIPNTNKFVAVLSSFSKNKVLQEELQKSKDIINYLPDPTFAIDCDGIVIAWNKAMEQLSGIAAKNMVGKDDYQYSIPFYGIKRPVLINYILNPSLIMGKYYTYLRQEESILVAESFAPKLRHGQGAFLWASASLIRDSAGNIIGGISTVKDFTEYRETQKKLKHLSTHDILTGLYNRTYYEEEIKRLNNSNCFPVSVIMCDLNGLKLINDTMGHHRGDQLLQAAANVLQSCLRTSDFVARIGGDEFVLILPKSDKRAAEDVCVRIKEAVKTYTASNQEFPLSLSLGCATGQERIEVITIEADNNLNKAKLHQSSSAKGHLIATLMTMLAERDYITEGHAERLEKMAEIMAETTSLSLQDKSDLLLLAKFHDIGKVGVPDKLLFKEAKLTLSEKKEMEKHAEVGFRIAQSSPDLTHIARYILHHHEWWDGTGYPLGLKKREIPLVCRIISILDAYDAMTSDRPYRKALNCAEAMQKIEESKGTQFDPNLTEIFFKVIEQTKCYAGISSAQG